MNGTLASHPAATALALLAAAHHGDHAPFWIFGGIVIIALTIGAVVSLTRRRRRLSEPGNPDYRQPQEYRHGF
jgi:hypothetical protein